VELAAALFVTMLSGWAYVCYRMLQHEVRETRDILHRELERMGRRVDTATQANTGAQILAKNAIARAERAEAKASKPVVLIVAPANDGDLETQTIKTQ